MGTASKEQLSTLSNVRKPGTHQPQGLNYALHAHSWPLLTMIENLKKKILELKRIKDIQSV